MADKTSIEWTRGDDGTPGATWNPTLGCSRVSEGCRHCYAERLAPRLNKPDIVRVTPRGPEWTGKVLLLPERLDVPLRWKRPRRVFVDSMSDLFHPEVPFDFILKVFDVMRKATRHTFQVLTKRPERMAEVVPGIVERPLPNVWLGTSVEDQTAADERIPHLLRTPATVRFLSCEPLLGPVGLDLQSVIAPGRVPRNRHLHWVIVGGESGPSARPMDLAWARSLVQQCGEAGVPVFVKQLGAHPIVRGVCSPACAPGPQEFQSEVLHAKECKRGVVVWPDRELHDRKGGDPSEWPVDLRVREYPEVS